MKTHCGLAVFFMAVMACSVQARGQDRECDASEGNAVRSLDELPAPVLDLLGRQTGMSGIADLGGPFNPSDVIIDDSIPMRRLVSGVAGHHCIVLIVEYGGLGYHQKTLEYRLVADSWIQLREAKPRRAPPVLPAVIR